MFAEVLHQVRVAERERLRAERAAARAYATAVRKAEQKRKAEERARVEAARAAEADRKRFEREAKAAHVEMMLAEVDERNARLAQVYDEIDGLLAATLDVDDYVDLDALRQVVEHPPFDQLDLEEPTPRPDPIKDPAEPVLVLPDPPTGFFRRKQRHAHAIAVARAEHERRRARWKVLLAANATRRAEAEAEHARAEAERTAALEEQRRQYAKQCAAREAEADERNAAIDALVANLGYGTTDAVKEYISIVLSNSVYPDHFEVQHDFEFQPDTAELRLRASIPGPDAFPTTKSFKYTKSSDEISATPNSQKVNKERYATATHRVALRTLHEVFEADRRGIIRSIDLQVGAETIDPATGNPAYIPFVAVAADRERFMEFNLAAVVPQATLEHLGASMSRNPFGLVAADTSGIRRS